MYISECLDSVIDSSLENIEILCVNDGSTDSTKTILSKCAEQDYRVKNFETKNTGVISARNLAINHSKSELVFCLDCDDKIDKFAP